LRFRIVDRALSKQEPKRKGRKGFAKVRKGNALTSDFCLLLSVSATGDWRLPTGDWRLLPGLSILCWQANLEEAW